MRQILMMATLAVLTFGFSASAYSEIRPAKKTIISRTISADRSVRHIRVIANPVMQLQRFVFRVLGIDAGGSNEY